MNRAETFFTFQPRLCVENAPVLSLCVLPVWSPVSFVEYFSSQPPLRIAYSGASLISCLNNEIKHYTVFELLGCHYCAILRYAPFLLAHRVASTLLRRVFEHEREYFFGLKVSFSRFAA